jgi:hypothetical protein
VGVGVGDFDGVGVGVGYFDGVGVGVDDGVGVGVGDFVGVGVGVGVVHRGKLTLFVVVPVRLGIVEENTSTRRVLKPWPEVNIDTLWKQPWYVVVPGTMLKVRWLPVSTKTGEPGT